MPDTGSTTKGLAASVIATLTERVSDAADLATRAGRSPQWAQDVLNGSKQLTVDEADQLLRAAAGTTLAAVAARTAPQAE